MLTIAASRAALDAMPECVNEHLPVGLEAAEVDSGTVASARDAVAAARRAHRARRDAKDARERADAVGTVEARRCADRAERKARELWIAAETAAVSARVHLDHIHTPVEVAHQAAGGSLNVADKTWY